MKKLLSLVMALCMVLGMASFAAAEDTLPTFDQIVLGENTDLTAKIHFAYHRTDIPDKLNGYVEEFRKTYPNIEIEYELITDYAENALLRVDNTDWTMRTPCCGSTTPTGPSWASPPCRRMSCPSTSCRWANWRPWTDCTTS